MTSEDWEEKSVYVCGVDLFCFYYCLLIRYDGVVSFYFIHAWVVFYTKLLHFILVILLGRFFLGVG